MAANIVPWNSSDTGKKYISAWEQYCDENKYPWVEIGNLYVTIIEAGGASCWDTLVTQLMKKGVANQVLMTGRHGNAIGTTFKLGQGGLTDDLLRKAGEHTAHDAELAKLVMSGRGKFSLNLEVHDCSRYNSDGLRQATLGFLQRGYAVIYAWCYSLYTFNEHISDSSGSLRPVAATHIVDCHNVQINEVVRRHFRWAFTTRPEID